MKRAIPFLAILAALVAAVTFIIGQHGGLALFMPEGPVARAEASLFVIAALLMFAVAIPVFALYGFFAWKYRARDNAPTLVGDERPSARSAVLWWAIPATVVSILAVVAWHSTHALDPYRPLASDEAPMTIQVVALRWKWLFIYPKERIATVNYLAFPAGRPVTFELTADAPMNSFWIPALGGQMYAMEGMVTKLHLMADAPGEFAGSSAELSGPGFAGMRFVARASSEADFDRWVEETRRSERLLDMRAYSELAEAGEAAPSAYGSIDPALYTTIVMKFMTPASTETAKTTEHVDALREMHGMTH